jgi:sulfofructose kinase
LTEIDVLGVGAVSVDFVGLLENWPEPGVKTEVPGLALTGGGLVGTALTAVGRLGGSAAWMGKLGSSEMAERALLMLADEGVDVSHVVREEGAEPHLAVVLTGGDGRRNIFYSRRGVRYPFPEEIEPAFWLRRPKVLLFDGGSGEAGGAFAREARSRGVAVVIDVEIPRPTVTEALALSDHVVVPESFARHKSESDSPRDMLAALRGRPGQTAVITRGEKGCLASGPEGEFDLAAFEVPVVDTTGCGDVFHGVYALALARGRPLEERCVLASAAAALSARGIGGRAAIPTDGELRRFLEDRPPKFRQTDGQP